MARLEEMTTGSSISGIAGQKPVIIVAVKWYGNAVLEITLKDAKGQPASQLLCREDEDRSAVYQEMIPCLPLRYILADDPGAGKTMVVTYSIRDLTNGLDIILERGE
jgi:hypothetical protein